jgi:hypothetical protein
LGHGWQAQKGQRSPCHTEKTAPYEIKRHGRQIVLKHQEQPNRWGCMYYSTWAITGDNRFLEDTSDVSTMWFKTRVIDLGYLWVVLYIHPWRQPLESDAWAGFWTLEPDQYNALLVTIQNPTSSIMHQVAVECHHDHIMVSDSAMPELQKFSHAEFLETQYAQALEIAVILDKADVAEFDQPGAEFFARVEPEMVELVTL